MQNFVRASARGGKGAGSKKPLSDRNEILHRGVPDIITHAKFCGHRFRGFGDSGGQISKFSIDLH